MVEVEAKIIKQIEYYFSDINIVKDNHLKQLIENSTDGWVGYDDLLKFPRLKSISEDKEAIKTAIQNSGSVIVEANDDGIRRNVSLAIPENLLGITEKHLDKSVYVKGFSPKETIDTIMEYLETHGGPTMNIHMRRLPKDKTFKGSVFAVFKTVEDAEKFLSNEESLKFKGNDMVKTWQKDYLEAKKTEYDERHKEKEIRQKELIATKEALLQSKMTVGALIEFSMVKKDENSEEKGDFDDARDEKASTKTFKSWLTLLVSDIAPVAWVEFFPISKKIIVRLGKENSAELALKKLCESEHAIEGKEAFNYQIYEFSGIVLKDEKEKDYWRNILTEQGQKRKRNDRNAGPYRKKMRR